MSVNVSLQHFSGRHLRRGAWVASGLIVSGVVALSCRPTGTPSGEMAAYRLALEETAGVRSTDEAVIADGVERFVSMFGDFRPQPVRASALALYAESAHFDDGFATLDNNVAIAGYLQRSAGHVDGLDVVIADTVVSDGEVYVRWEMRFAGAGSVTDVAGISHLRFGDGGQIIYHRDHWDASGALADRAPALGRVLRWIKSRI